MCVGVGDKREKGDDRSGNNEEEQNSTHQNSEEEEKRDRPDIPYREEEGAELQQKTKLRKTKVESNETQDCQPGKNKKQHIPAHKNKAKIRNLSVGQNEQKEGPRDIQSRHVQTAEEQDPPNEPDTLGRLNYRSWAQKKKQKRPRERTSTTKNTKQEQDAGNQGDAGQDYYMRAEYRNRSGGGSRS